MIDYKIFIPTRDRPNAQFTWANLPAGLQAKAQLVCPEEEVESHFAAGRLALARPKLKLAGVRQWLVETNTDCRAIIMLDDDLSFFVRKSPDAHNLRQAEDDDVIKIFDRLYEMIESGEVHGGLSPRQGNNWLYPETVVYNTRMNAVHCVNPTAIVESGVRYDEVDMMEDYHVTLSLLKKGIRNFQIADAAWDQNRGSGAPGGFSHYRTSETQEKAALRLAELHPDVVTVTRKTPKTGSGGFSGERVDVRVGWKKAAKIGGAE